MEFEDDWIRLTSKDTKYVDAFITKVYYGRNNRNYEWYFDQWKRLWNNREVLIVEGTKTRFGVGNDLMDNADSVTRIIAPSEGAYEKYEAISGMIKEHIKNDILILIALGLTAAILAFDIGRTGVQTIDIGHIDVEYEWYKSDAKKKIPIIDKYVNEAGGDSMVEMDEGLLKKYNLEIIEKI